MKMNDMTGYYACQVEQIFYLKENQGLTREEKNEKICEILYRLQDDVAEASKRKTLNDVERSIKSLR